MSRTLLHPQRLTRGVGALFFPHPVTVLAVNIDAANDDESSPAYTPFLGNIAAREGAAKPSGSASFDQEEGDTVLLLKGFYPQIKKSMQVRLTRRGGSVETYLVQGVAFDNDETLTRLNVKTMN